MCGVGKNRYARFFFFSSRRRHTICGRDWSSDVCSSDLEASSNAFYFLLSAAGLGAVLLASHDAFTVLKWCGAVYLVYLGVRLIFAPGGPVGIRSEERRVGKECRARGWSHS